MKKFPGVAVIIPAVLLAMPFLLSSYGIQLASEIYIVSIFVMSLGLIIGYAGLASLGHAAFFGTGAYTIALLGNHIPNSYILIILAIIFAGFLAWLSGWLFIRTSGAYFIMITLAFSQMLYAIAYKSKELTGGADGMKVSAQLDLGFGAISGSLEFYYLVAAAFLISYFLLRFFVSSPFGKGVKGVMENQLRMKALGYNVRTYQLVAYTISGMMAGFAGAMYAYFNSYISPELLSWMFSGQALIMVSVGGAGTLLGPAIGAGFFVVLQNYVSSFTERWPLIMGLVFVCFVLYGRGGIIHILQYAWRKFTPKNSHSANVEDEEKYASRHFDETRGKTK